MRGSVSADDVAVYIVPETDPDGACLPSGFCLSLRQQQCLTLLADGHTPAEIGRELKIATCTVRVYLFRSRERLGGRNMVHAVALALRAGII